jgi:hypothetical protein
VSVFFPWTLPTDPYFFTRSSNNEWVLRTAFETYCEYDFAQESQWSSFLESFFKATLRRVRRSSRDFALKEDGKLAEGGLVQETVHAPSEVLAIDLQKSSSDTGKVDPDVWSTVKNYPRRNYLSPSDCARKVEVARRCVQGQEKFEDKDQPPVSYLGWNLTGIVAEVVNAAVSSTPTNGNKNEEVKVAAATAALVSCAPAGVSTEAAPAGSGSRSIPSSDA